MSSDVHYSKFYAEYKKLNEINISTTWQQYPGADCVINFDSK